MDELQRVSLGGKHDNCSLNGMNVRAALDLRACLDVLAEINYATFEKLGRLTPKEIKRISTSEDAFFDFGNSILGSYFGNYDDFRFEDIVSDAFFMGLRGILDRPHPWLFDVCDHPKRRS